MTTAEAAAVRMQRRRTSVPHLVMILAGVCGLVLTLAALRDGGGRQRIAVAARDLLAGAVLRRSDLRFASVHADRDLHARLVSPKRATTLPGRVTTVAMRGGDPFVAGHVSAPIARDGRRAISIPVDRARAVNGALVPGDRVDVVAAADDAVQIVAAGVEVLAIDDPDGGAFSARRGEITVTLAVDVRESQLLTEALAAGDFVITRVTGASSSARAAGRGAAAVTIPAAREVEIALVLSPDAWVERLHRHCADHGGARVRCVVVDPGGALQESFDVLVVSGRWPALTRPFVDALNARGRRVVAVVDDEVESDGLVHRLGVDAVVRGSVAPSELVAAVVTSAPVRTRDTVAAANTVDEPAGAAGAVAPPLVAVGGPFGAGATEVALALATAWARRGANPVLVDADGLTPSIAVRLGLPLEPNLCTAVDAVVYGLGEVPAALLDLGHDWPAVLVGVPTRAAAAGLTSADVVAVAEALAARYAPVVCDVGVGGALSATADDLAADVLARAAGVVAVGSATPVGTVRFLEWLATTGHAAGRPVHVVANRTPRERSRRAEIAAEIAAAVRGHPEPAAVTFVPADPRVDDAAWRATAVDRGPFGRAIDGLVDRLAATLDACGVVS